MKVFGYIYMIRNIINDKKYIGLTTRKSIESRWKEHIHTAFDLNNKDSTAPFKKAIRKYGPDNFELSQLDICYTNLDELKELEMYWIQYYNTFLGNPNSQGYNATIGGDSAGEYCKRPVVQCDITQGKIIKYFSSIKEAEKEIGCKIEAIGETNRTHGGYCFLDASEVKDKTEEEIEYIIYNLYPDLLYQLDMNGNIVGIYKNTTDVIKTYPDSNINPGNINSCCVGDRRLAHGYQWCRQKDLPKRVGSQPPPIIRYQKPVCQYDLDGNFLQKYSSISEAANKYNILDTKISNCCSGKRKRAGCFQWRYLEEKVKQTPQIITQRPVLCVETQQIFRDAYHAAKYFKYAQQTVQKSCLGYSISKPYHFEFVKGHDIEKYYKMEEEDTKCALLK